MGGFAYETFIYRGGFLRILTLKELYSVIILPTFRRFREKENVQNKCSLMGIQKTNRIILFIKKLHVGLG